MTRSRTRHRRYRGGRGSLALLLALAIGLGLFGGTAALLDTAVSAQGAANPTGSTGSGSGQGGPGAGGGSPSDGSANDSAGDSTDDSTSADDGADAGTAAPPDYAAPTLSSVTLQKDGILVSWQAPSTDLTIDEFAVERSNTGGGGGFTPVFWEGDDTTRSFLDKLADQPIERLASGYRWVYRVRAIYENADGTVSHGDWSAELGVTLPTFPKPTSPALDLNEFKYDQTRAELSWEAPTLSWSNTALPHSGYILHRTLSANDGKSAPQTTLVGRATASGDQYSEYLSTSYLKSNKVQYTIRATYGIFFSQPVQTSAVGH